jgi:hypothetical protein
MGAVSAKLAVHADSTCRKRFFPETGHEMKNAGKAGVFQNCLLEARAGIEPA